ncbi:hypothetical protein B0H17DRAFT_1139237 [Mycena rosella]|uniref:Uncharacterized protein n=1 Tax=Mycena rosella TaxID=1033263 RepID=A0AAD7D4K1_MYCRO|nr:hypothetical protein B0H17DRAFT_1139237 [Mycena rosella]
MSLSSFNRVIGRRRTPLIERVSDILSRVEDHQLRSILATEVICSWMVAPIQNVDDWIMRGRESLVKANDPSQEVKFYNIVGRYYHLHNDKVKALQFYDIAFKFADKLVDGVLQGTVRDSLAMVQWSVGNYSHGRQLAHEAVQCARIKSDLHLEAVATRTEAMCCAGLGDFSHSAYLCARSRELLALCGLRGGTVNLLVSITEADVLLRKTEYAESRKIYAAMAREISPEHSPYEYAIALLNLATLDINMGASANTIRQNLNSAKAIVEGQSPSMCFSCDATLADLELRKGHPGTAKPTLERIYSTTRWAAVLLGVKDVARVASRLRAVANPDM